MPFNNSLPDAEHVKHAEEEGFDITDFQPAGQEAADIDKAIGAATAKALDMCKKNCCKIVQIEIQCGKEQAQREHEARLPGGNQAGTPDRCGTTIDVNCQ